MILKSNKQYNYAQLDNVLNYHQTKAIYFFFSIHKITSHLPYLIHVCNTNKNLNSPIKWGEREREQVKYCIPINSFLLMHEKRSRYDLKRAKCTAGSNPNPMQWKHVSCKNGPTLSVLSLLHSIESIIFTYYLSLSLKPIKSLFFYWKRGFL